MFAKIVVLAFVFAFATVAEADPKGALPTPGNAPCITCWR